MTSFSPHDPSATKDPPAQMREWYRSATSGQRGWKVLRGKNVYIKIDRPEQDIEQLWREGDWIAEKERRPLTKWQIAKVSFEADRELCRVLGLVAASKREWHSLKEEIRQDWMREGPAGSTAEATMRQALYDTIMDHLEPYCLE